MLFLALKPDKAPKSPQGQEVDATYQQNSDPAISTLAKVPFHFHILDFRLGLMCRHHSLSVPTVTNTNTKCTSCFSLWKLY